MDTHAMLRTLVQRVGTSVFTDADELRSILDDFTSDADLATGQQNLLVDAVRLGGYEHLDRMLAAGADPAEAVAAAGDRLAQERGSTDPTGARWACAALGFAADVVPEAVVRHYLRPPTTRPRGLADESTPAQRRQPQQPQTQHVQPRTDRVQPQTQHAQPQTDRVQPQTDRGLQQPATRADGTSDRRRRFAFASAGLLLVAAALAAVALSTDLLTGDDNGGASGRSPDATLTSGGEPGTASPDGGDETGPGGDVTSGPESDGGTGGGDQQPVQAPFESVEMWAMAWPYFDPADCKVPTTQAEAPLAWSLDWSELVKCLSDDYGATFLCTDNSAQLAEARAAFLGKAVDAPRSLDGHPADQPGASVQVAFRHEGSGTRVYWDSQDQLCLAELQSTSAELSEVIRIWRRGMPR
jgi:hypothetical protein